MDVEQQLGQKTLREFLAGPQENSGVQWVMWRDGAGVVRTRSPKSGNDAHVLLRPVYPTTRVIGHLRHGRSLKSIWIWQRDPYRVELSGPDVPVPGEGLAPSPVPQKWLSGYYQNSHCTPFGRETVKAILDHAKGDYRSFLQQIITHKDLITDDLVKNTSRSPIFTSNMVHIILSWVADESIRHMDVEWIDLSILNACTDVLGHYLTNRDMALRRHHNIRYRDWEPVVTRTSPVFARALLLPDATANDPNVISFQNAIQQVAIEDDVEKSPRRAAAVTAVLYAGMLRAAAQLDADNAAHAEKVVSGLGLAFIALDIVIGIAPIPSQAKELKAYLNPLEAHLVKMEQANMSTGNWLWFSRRFCTTLFS